MPAIDARFAVLALFCCLSTHWLSSTTTARAAVISRGSQSSDSPYKAYSDDGASYSQHVFPWSRGKPGVSKNQDHSRRWLIEGNEGRYKVRSEGFFASNPFHRLADDITSLLKGHHKRSHKTIAIPNDHGSLYVLSHSRRADTPQWVSMPNSTAAQGNATAAQSGSASQGVPGHVDITSTPDSSDGLSKRIASLVLEQMNGTYILNASENNQTRLYLVDAQNPTTRGPEAASSGEGGDDVPALLVFPGLVDNENYCATYDPTPDHMDPMTMQPCFDDNASSPHASQTFLYNQRSGQIRPTWFSGEDDGTDGYNSTSDGNNPATTAQGGYPQRPGSGSPQGQRPGFSSQDSDPNPNARNVTLVFVPAAKFGAADVTESSTSSVVTATTTTTVTVYASATGFGSVASFSASATSSGTSPSASGMSVEAVGGVPIVGSAVPSLPVSPPVSPPTPGVAKSASSASASASASTGSSSVSASSMGAAAITASPYASPYDVSSSSSPSASSSTSINATAIAASIASSAASSYSSWSSASAASATGVAASASPSSTYVAAVLRRGRMPRRRAASPDKTPVNTAPYSWKFKAESR